jgi:tetratricopeptide (TPR) repeat protein
LIYEKRKLYDSAIREWQAAFVLRNREDMAALLGKAYRRGGYREAIRMWARTGQGVSPAASYAAIGDKEQALELLTKAAQQGEILQKLSVHPRFDSVRTEPSFQALQTRFGPRR